MKQGDKKKLDSPPKQGEGSPPGTPIGTLYFLSNYIEPLEG